MQTLTVYHHLLVIPDHKVLSRTSEGIVLARSLMDKIDFIINNPDKRFKLTPKPYAELIDARYVVNLSEYDRMTISATNGLIAYLSEKSDISRYHFTHTKTDIILKGIQRSMDYYQKYPTIFASWDISLARIQEWLISTKSPKIEYIDMWERNPEQPESDSTI